MLKKMRDDFEEEKMHRQDEMKRNSEIVSKTKADMLDLQEKLQEKEKKILQSMNELEEMNDKFEQEKKRIIEEGESERERLEKILKGKNEEVATIEKFVQEKDSITEFNRELAKKLQEQREEREKKIAAKQVDKVKATDKLKKEMLEKIQVTKTELFALKKEQLEPKTRLTVLQNYQLTTELEYQSKQTEKLFFKNQKLIEHVKALKRDVEIHKQVETELAKRSHFCDKLIGKLKGRLSKIEEECEELHAEVENNRNNAQSLRDNNIMKERRMNLMHADENKFEDKLSHAQNEYELMEHELKRIADKSTNDVRRLKILKCLLAKCLKPLHKSIDEQYEWNGMSKREKDVLISKLIQLLDVQIEVGFISFLENR